MYRKRTNVKRQRSFLDITNGFSFCCVRPRLGLVLLSICLVSVALNVFLIFFRTMDLSLHERSEEHIPSSGFERRPLVRGPIAHDQAKPKIKPQTKRNGTQQTMVDPSLLAQHHPFIVSPARNVARTSKEPHVLKKTDSKIKKETSHVTKSSALTVISKKLPLCPLISPALIGPLRAVTEVLKIDKLEKLFQDVEMGGRIRPKNCTSRQRMAIIIPFRNRHMHLNLLLRNLIPFLQRQQADATIFIIEQAPPSTFNRGALLNVGFLEAQKQAKFDCFILHDVDLIPLNDKNLYRCGQNPRHYAVAISKFGFKLMYPEYFGGVVGFSTEQLQKVNGNSNLYFGWGGEDDDLALRIANKNYTMDRFDLVTSRYWMVKHSRDKGNDKNIERRRLMSSATRRQDIEGLNTCLYQVNSIRPAPLYTWINVSLSMADIMGTAPNYTRHDIWKTIRDVKLGKLQR